MTARVLVTVRPGPVLHVWRAGREVAVVPLDLHGALALARPCCARHGPQRRQRIALLGLLRNIDVARRIGTTMCCATSRRCWRKSTTPSLGRLTVPSNIGTARGRSLKEYLLPRDLTVTLILGYRADLIAAAPEPQPVTMSSREIAELVEKRHDDVLRWPAPMGWSGFSLSRLLN